MKAPAASATPLSELRALSLLGIGAVLPAAVTLVVALAARAYAAPIVWPRNGHSYEVVHVPGGLTWAQAYDSCAALGAYLATLTTPEEHAFVVSLASDRPEAWFLDGIHGPWLGGFRAPAASDSATAWRWDSGEPFDEVQWSPGNPDDFGGIENRVHLIRIGRAVAWNDIGSETQLPGFVRESDPPGRAHAPVRWPVNGHSYQAVHAPRTITWGEARDSCLAAGGHLATIESAEENAFVFGLVRERHELWAFDPRGLVGLGPFLGGAQISGSAEPDRGWRWLPTGEPFGYSRWEIGQPDDFNGNEDYLHFFGSGRLIADTWNDLSGNARLRAYVVEFEPNGSRSP